MVKHWGKYYPIANYNQFFLLQKRCLLISLREQLMNCLNYTVKHISSSKLNLQRIILSVPEMQQVIYSNVMLLEVCVPNGFAVISPANPGY